MVVPWRNILGMICNQVSLLQGSGFLMDVWLDISSIDVYTQVHDYDSILAGYLCTSCL
jgi:hypothetical protein